MSFPELPSRARLRRAVIIRRQRGWDTARDGEEPCGMPKLLPILSIPLLAFVILIILLVRAALT